MAQKTGDLGRLKLEGIMWLMQRAVVYRFYGVRIECRPVNGVDNLSRDRTLFLDPFDLLLSVGRSLQVDNEWLDVH